MPRPPGWMRLLGFQLGLARAPHHPALSRRRGGGSFCYSCCLSVMISASVAITASAASDFSTGDEKLTSRDKARRVEHDRVIEIVRVDSLSGFRQLVAELGGDAEVLLREYGIEPRALDDEDHYVSFRNFM